MKKWISKEWKSVNTDREWKMQCWAWGRPRSTLPQRVQGTVSIVGDKGSAHMWRMGRNILLLGQLLYSLAIHLPQRMGSNLGYLILPNSDFPKEVDLRNFFCRPQIMSLGILVDTKLQEHVTNPFPWQVCGPRRDETCLVCIIEGGLAWESEGLVPGLALSCYLIWASHLSSVGFNLSNSFCFLISKMGLIVGGSFED